MFRLLKPFACTLLFFALLCAPALADDNENEPDQSSDSTMADVFTLPFVNQTGNPAYDWLGPNLSRTIINSMEKKFDFNKPDQQQLAPGMALVFPDGNTNTLLTNEQAKILSDSAGTDIIIYGSYTWNAEKKVVIVQAQIFHRSRGMVTRTIEMETPVTGAMFAVVDKVADAAVAHIRDIALEDAAAQKQPSPETNPVQPDNPAPEQKITLVKADNEQKNTRWPEWNMYLGLAVNMPFLYFDQGLDIPGFAAHAGVCNSNDNFLHYGLEASLIWQNGKDAEENAIDWMLFAPLTFNFGFNLPLSSSFVFTPSLGIGAGIQAMAVSPVDEDPSLNFYLEPCAASGLRLSILLDSMIIAPFARLQYYAGDNGNEFKIGAIGLVGVELHF